MLKELLTPNIEETKNAAGEDRSLRLLIRLLRSAQMVRNGIRIRLDEEFGTTLAKWDTIATLAQRPQGMTMSHLSKALMVSNGNVTQLVDRLIDEGIVTRKVNAKDRRFATATLTKKGRRLFLEIGAANKRWVDEMLTNVSPDHVDNLNAQLATLIGALKSQKY